MTAVIPFDGSAKLPAYLARAKELPSVNDDIVTAAAYPTMSIKGKQFAQVRDGMRQVLMKPDDPDEVAQKIEVAVLRVNMHARVFYAKKFSEDDSNGVPPDCFSMDGKAPSANAQNKQADHCATCKHSVWGTGNVDKGTGRACSDSPRMAIASPDNLDDALLLRVPPASIKNWKDAIKVIKPRNLQYNMLVYRLGFDKEQASPVLTFKPVGLLDDAGYGKAVDMYDGELVRSIVGMDEPAMQPRAKAAPAAQPETEVDADELDAALAAKQATAKAATAAKAKPKPEPKVDSAELDAAAPAPEPAPAPAPKPSAKAAASDDLLGGLTDLLGATDD